MAKRWMMAALLGVLLVPAAEVVAGAPPGWRPGVEGQYGFGPVVWSPDGSALAATGWDRAGLVVVAASGGEPAWISTERGAGFEPRWHGSSLLFKQIVSVADGSAVQQVVEVDLARGEPVVLDESRRLGQPAVAADGARLWVREDALVRQGASVQRLPGYCNLAVPDPVGERVAFDHPDGSVGLMSVTSGDVLWLLGPGANSHPAWSDDGALLLVRTPLQRFVVLDASSGQLLADVEGTHPSWIPGTHDVVFERVVEADYAVLTSDLWQLDARGGRHWRLAASPDHERYPAASPDGRWLAYVDTTTGDLRVAALEGDRLGRPRTLAFGAHLPDSPPPPNDSLRLVEVEVPYMHQLWDTPDDFHGGWSCGPTSCVQTIQKYDKLPDHDITCSWPHSHTSHWGWYIPNEYTYNGYTYDTPGLAAGEVWVVGAHGFICLELGAAWWAQMVTFCNQHDVTSWQAGTSYSSLTAEIDAGYPMYASTAVLGYGHILVIKGYDSDHSIVVNDPYGDGGSGSWGNYDGEGAVYDWPGYNNGNLTDFTMSQLFGAQGPLEPPDPEWGASYVAQHYPAEMASGDCMEVWIDYLNEGTEAWQPGETFLGTTEPRDRESAFVDDAWTGASRPATVDATTAPGEVGRFTFTLSAPVVDADAVYTEHWGLVQEGVAWFGPADDAVWFEITVLAPQDEDPGDDDDDDGPGVGPGDDDDGGGGCTCGVGRPSRSGGVLAVGALGWWIARRRKVS